MKQKKLDYASMFNRRSDGRYQAHYYDDDGKRHTICDKDPERLWHKINDPIENNPITFAKIAETWQAVHFDRVGYKTAEAYKAPLRRLLDRFGDEAAEDITPQMVYAYLCEMGKKNYARRTVQMSRDIINMVYNNAIVDGVVSSNPCSAISMPRNLSTTKRQLPSDDAVAAVQSSTAPFSLFAKFCLYSGLRRGEVLALRYEDIDREEGNIHVTKSVEFLGNNPHIKSPKTASGYRDAVLIDALAKEIPTNKVGFIFAREDGGMLTKTQFRKRWEAYCKEIGHDITPHQLRHGYATILYEAGVPDKDAQELLGHSSITVTRDIYTHIRKSRKDETRDKINAFVKLHKSK